MTLTMCNGYKLLGIYDPTMVIFKMIVEIFRTWKHLVRVDFSVGLYKLCEVCPKNILEV
jgi:hypothetical protein